MSRYFHDYDNVAILDLNEELAMGEHAYEISSLFPKVPTPAESSPSPQEGQGKNSLQWGWIVMPALVLVALVAWYRIHKLRGK